jgi:uncharacterized cupredoxin-like copper-binding protein
MQQTYFCPNCTVPIAYGQGQCGNCGMQIDWSGVQNTDQQQAGWDQQAGWNQPPPDNQGAGQGYQDQYQQQYQQQTQQQSRLGKAGGLLKKKSSMGIMALMMVLVIAVIAAGGIFIATNGTFFASSNKPQIPGTQSPGGSTSEKPPAVKSFTADPAAITAGQSTNLKWDISGATSVSIDPGIGAVSTTSGSQAVSPTANTSYTLKATNSAGSVTATVAVAVAAAGPPKINSFIATPINITPGGSSTLTWDVTGATSFSVEPGFGTVTAQKQLVSPGATTTYTLTATNGSGSTTATAIVTVTSTGMPVISSFTATPTTVTAGGSATLTWSITGATSASINGVGTVSATSGTATVTPSGETTYTLSATNVNGSVTRSVTVTLPATGPPVIASFTATPTAIYQGQSTNLSWSVTGATSLSIDQGVGNQGLTATPSLSPNANTTYTLTATNANGSVNKSVTVMVAPPGSPLITGFTSSTYNVSSGQSAILTWSITGATSASISGVGAVTATTGTQTVTPSATTAYTLTATNASGSSSSLPVTVTVAQTGVPIITSFIANPASINTGSSSKLQWNITGATSVSIDQGVGSVSPLDIGSKDVIPAAGTAYTITATNATGSATKSATITVSALTPPVITSFRADPDHISAGEYSTLRWTITGITPGVDTVSIDQGIGVLPPSNSYQVSPSVTTTYVLTATNAAGSTTATATVYR